MLVDVFFYPILSAFPFPDIPRPSAKQRGLVERFGGVILRPFNFPGLRAWMPTDSVPKLARTRADSVYPIQLRTVPDPRRYDASVDVLFRSDTAFAGVADRIAERGGRVVLHGVPNFVNLILPNRAIPEARR
jgi:hypothetical protein